MAAKPSSKASSRSATSGDMVKSKTPSKAARSASSSKTKTAAGSRNPSIKNPDVYEALREQGASAEKAARISNAQAKFGTKGEDAPSQKGGKAPPYEEWTRDDLRKKVREIGIMGLSAAKKAELIDALRSH